VGRLSSRVMVIVRPAARLVAASRLSRSPSITRTGASWGGWETRPHLSGSEREPFPFFRVGAWSSRAFSGSADSGPSAFSSPEVRVVGGVSVGRSSSPLPGSNLPPLACSTFSGAPRKVSPKVAPPRPGRSGRQDGELPAVVTEPLPVVLVDHLDRGAAVPGDPLEVRLLAERGRDERVPGELPRADAGRPDEPSPKPPLTCVQQRAGHPRRREEERFVGRVERGGHGAEHGDDSGITV